MRILLGAILILVAVWSGYWHVSSAAITNGFAAWFGARQNEGWLAEYSEIETRGFPNRFDTTISDVTIADPEARIAWESPFFQILALSYKPNHLIAVWPSEQTATTPSGKYLIASEDMKASIVLDANAEGEPLFRRVTYRADNLSVRSETDEREIRAASIVLAAESAPAHVATYRIGVEAAEISPAISLLSAIDSSLKLPDSFEALHVDARVAFDRPWGRSSIESARPQPKNIKLNKAAAQWGRLEIKAAGELEIDGAGMPAGEIVVKATNWREILNLAVSSGIFKEGHSEILEPLLSSVARLKGNPNTLDIPFTFRNGLIWFKFIPLGPSPVISLR
ncbi:MAG: DUF2125 domain-containing protein [Roseovarius sp.]|nr:DUF2125 domain-containing protein [Roseovarius sp.]MCY4314723.1 DUF2125 domain-containing protein [Roseovarius sp.]